MIDPPPFRIVNRAGEIVRERREPERVTKVCPYCWEAHQAHPRASAFCTPEHAARWRRHVRGVLQGRSKAWAL